MLTWLSHNEWLQSSYLSIGEKWVGDGCGEAVAPLGSRCVPLVPILLKVRLTAGQSTGQSGTLQNGFARQAAAIAAYLVEWSGRRGSNSRHLPWQGSALPTELRPRFNELRLQGCVRILWNQVIFERLLRRQSFCIRRLFAMISRGNLWRKRLRRLQPLNRLPPPVPEACLNRRC